MVKLTFGNCKNPKKVTYFPSTIFTPESERLSAAIRNGSTKTFEMVSFGYVIEREAVKIFVLVYSLLSQRNRLWTKKHCF